MIRFAESHDVLCFITLRVGAGLVFLDLLLVATLEGPWFLGSAVGGGGIGSFITVVKVVSENAVEMAMV
ncbi:hypothetical protein BZA05DRAFT_388912, partial [Tricharina praecox]|uniref:uncharacterized protein n=1 Tax=Tricharina praecox TaxID=43433 RepID=UPI00221FE051